MIQEIVHNPLMLSVPSEAADETDLVTAQDLLDTLSAHADGCVGLAANMIGVRKRVIAVADGAGGAIAMLNPEIVASAGRHTTSEGCLSLPGTTEVERFKRVTVEYTDVNLKRQKRTFAGLTAQAIQHEIDHCNGVLV